MDCEEDARCEVVVRGVDVVRTSRGAELCVTFALRCRDLRGDQVDAALDAALDWLGTPDADGPLPFGGATSKVRLQKESLRGCVETMCKGLENL